MIKRFSRDGNYIPNSREHRNTDFEITSTPYSHPDIKNGMHHNGPCDVWFRFIGKEWTKVPRTKSEFKGRVYVLTILDALDNYEELIGLINDSTTN